MSITIRGSGASHPATVLSLPDDPSNVGAPVRYLVMDIETHKGEKSRDRDKFVKTSQFVCASVYDSETDWTYHYGPDQLDRLVTHLEEADVVVSFNGNGYDMPVIENLIGRKLQMKRHFDLFEMLVNVTGELRGYSLGNVSRLSLGYGKIGTGKMAAELYERALAGGDDGVAALFELITYCSHDVRLTRNLLRFAQAHKFLIGPSGPVNLILPDLFLRLA